MLQTIIGSMRDTLKDWRLKLAYEAGSQAALREYTKLTYNHPNNPVDGWAEHPGAKELALKMLKARGSQPAPFDTRVQGFDVHIDRPKGYIHTFTGHPKAPTLAHVYKVDYGEFKDYRGKDGDKLDIFVGTDNGVKEIHVISKHDEDKVFVYTQLQHARELYPNMTGAKTFKDREDFKTRYLDKLPKQ